MSQPIHVGGVYHACDQRLAGKYACIGHLDEIDELCTQGRITNLHDVPALAPFFFVELDYTLPEAQTMKRGLSADDYGKSRTPLFSS